MRIQREYIDARTLIETDNTALFLNASVGRLTTQGIANIIACLRTDAGIDRQVTDQSPMATLFTPRHIDFLSKRVGNFTFSKQFYWLVDQSWVQ